MAKIQIGDAAPLFTLTNQNDQKVSLKDCLKKGPVLVYFYPKAMTPGCTTQACDIRDNIKFFNDNNYTVLAISPDSVDKLSNFADKYVLDFNLLSDADNKVAKLYDSYGEKSFMGKTYMGVFRNSFIIDKDQNIVHILENVKAKVHCDLVNDFINNTST